MKTCASTWRDAGSVWVCVESREVRCASYLQDYCADELDTLDYWLLIPRYRHPSFSRVGQQIPRHLYLSPGALQMIGGLKKRLSLIQEIRRVVITLPRLLSMPPCWLYWPYIFPPLLIRDQPHCGVFNVKSAQVRDESKVILSFLADIVLV